MIVEVDGTKADKCQHCYHTKRGPIMMVIADGHVVQECCKCHQVRTVHIEHMCQQ